MTIVIDSLNYNVLSSTNYEHLIEHSCIMCSDVIGYHLTLVPVLTKLNANFDDDVLGVFVR